MGQILTGRPVEVLVAHAQVVGDSDLGRVPHPSGDSLKRMLLDEIRFAGSSHCVKWLRPWGKAGPLDHLLEPGSQVGVPPAVGAIRL